MTFERWALGLLMALVVGIGSHIVDRLDTVSDQIADVRADVSALKARDAAIASLTPPLH